ncbi:MAG: ParB/RepB/Spo0J family partition protein, partial [Desulfobulbaceae bacterium]|nr:ParB/RepB/Spo0J family partition protein [Desulfobulbaceae bacterium]
CRTDMISPNPYQPRKDMESASLQQLASSIKEKGILQPLLVRKKESGDGYELIAGERRLQASKMAGLERVPVVVKDDTSKSDRLELAIIENIQRQNLNALEEAEAYGRLMQEFGHTQEDVAKKVGKERSTVANTLRLMQLPEYAKADLMSGALSAGHARVILSVMDEKAMQQIRDEILEKGLSVRQAEALAKKLKKGKAVAGNNSKRSRPDVSGAIPDSYCQALLNDMSRRLESSIKIIQNGTRGRIEIEYYSLDDLERLVSLISAQKS